MFVSGSPVVLLPLVRVTHSPEWEGSLFRSISSVVSDDKFSFCWLFLDLNTLSVVGTLSTLHLNGGSFVKSSIMKGHKYGEGDGDDVACSIGSWGSGE